MPTAMCCGATMAWGRLPAYEAYEDTQASRALDDYLATHEATPN